MFLGGNVKKGTKKVSRKIDSSLEEERKGEWKKQRYRIKDIFEIICYKSSKKYL